MYNRKVNENLVNIYCPNVFFVNLHDATSAQLGSFITNVNFVAVQMNK